MDGPVIETFNHLAYMCAAGRVMVWNRFYPSVLEFSESDFGEVLSLASDPARFREFDEDFLARMDQNHILGNVDYQEKYCCEMDAFVSRKSHDMRDFAERRLPFYSVQIYNEECNLRCSYCIMAHSWGGQGGRARGLHQPKQAVLANITRILDIQYEALEERPQDFVFSMNGGELMLHWDLVRGAVAYVRQVKGDKRSRIAINTNGTLITDDVARFIVENRMEVYISVDCNRDHHDSTRVYRSGAGSFDDVMTGLRRLKENGYAGDTLPFFQGTIDDFEKIDPAQFAELAEAGFKEARLSPNLIGWDAAEGSRRAVRYYQLIKDFKGKEISVYDSVFDGFKSAVDKGVNFAYWPYCNGLGGSSISNAMYNISSGCLSYLCQYVPSASVRMEEMDDAYSEPLVSRTAEFLRRRVESFKANCLDCSVAGVCRGGCIMSGLSAENEPNACGCAFQRALWGLFVKEIHDHKSKPSA